MTTTFMPLVILCWACDRLSPQPPAGASFRSMPGLCDDCAHLLVSEEDEARAAEIAASITQEELDALASASEVDDESDGKWTPTAEDMAEWNKRKEQR